MANAFGPYKLIRRVAGGGMGEVYLAVLQREGGFEKTLALKTILPSLASKADFAGLFETEAAMAAMLNHVNIVQVFDHGCIDGRSFLTMEYVEGPDLASLITALGDEPFPPAVASELGVQVCRGLAHAHARKDLRGRPVGIVHGDVSPSNILLSLDGVAKLVDFGLSRLRSSAGGAGVVTGKYSYMSPEQATGGPLSPRSDLFSLGLILYELFVGKRAYPLADPPSRTLEAVRTGKHLGPDQASGGSLDPSICRVLDRALALDQRQRHESASDLSRELAAACRPCGPEELSTFLARVDPQPGDRQGSTPEPTEVAGRPVSPHRPETETIQTAETAESAEGRSRSHTWLAGLLGLAVVFWGVGIGWWLLHSPPPPRPSPPTVTRPVAPKGLTATLAPPPHKESVPVPVPVPEKKPTRPAEPPPEPDPAPQPKIEIRFDPHLTAVLDHNPFDGRSIRILDERPHLVRLSPSNGGPPEVLLRLLPPGGAQAGWRLTVGSTPWMRIRLDGRPRGQTPRSGLVLARGTSTLELHRDDVTVRLILRIPKREDGP